MCGPDLLFTPLYTVFVHRLSFLTYGFEVRARLISLLAGILLLVPVALLASRWCGNAVALSSLFLVAVYLPLITLSRPALERPRSLCASGDC
jgi:hypothetical protein